MVETWRAAGGIAAADSWVVLCCQMQPAAAAVGLLLSTADLLSTDGASLTECIGTGFIPTTVTVSYAKVTPLP